MRIDMVRPAILCKEFTRPVFPDAAYQSRLSAEVGNGQHGVAGRAARGALYVEPLLPCADIGKARFIDELH